MIKKFLNEFYLPTHVALSFCFFVGSVIFALCFANPTWDYVQPSGSYSNYANMGATSSFAFVFGFWFIFDCFAYFEKSMKEKTRAIIALISEAGLILSLLVIYTIFIVLCPAFVVDWIHYLSFVILEALCCFSTYLRYKQRGGKLYKGEIVTAAIILVISLAFSIIFTIMKDYHVLILFAILIATMAGFVALEIYLKKNHKHNRALDETGGKEKGLFVILCGAPLIISFMPIWNRTFKGSENTTLAWLIISILYLACSIVLFIASIIGEFFVKRRSTRNSIRATSAILMMLDGGVGIVVTSATFNSGRSFPLEACYYMVAVGVGFLIYGLLAFFYEELRRNHREPKED